MVWGLRSLIVVLIMKMLMLMMMAKGEYVFDGSMMVYVDGADGDDANADYNGDGE